MERRDFVKIAGATVFGAGLPFSGIAAQDRYAKYRGQTIVINYPAHPHYDQAEKLFAEFTAETGIKIERDKLQYLRMKDRQVLEMGKPGGGDYDVISYVVMWKTEYVAKKLIEPMDPFFANTALADPTWDQRDIITGYWENITLVGGPMGYLPGPGAKPYGVPFGAETSVLGYRADLLQKYNLKPPATYDELLAACRLMKDKGIGGLTSRGQTPGNRGMPHLAPYGGLVTTQRRAAFTAWGVRAADVLRDRRNRSGGHSRLRFGEMVNAFLQGLGVLSGYAGYLAGVDQPEKIVGKIGYAPRRRKAGMIGGSGWRS
jgi:multiple sugar transport system substrate-binding protein